jgi:hypothetical protein
MNALHAVSLVDLRGYALNPASAEGVAVLGKETTLQSLLVGQVPLAKDATLQAVLAGLGALAHEATVQALLAALQALPKSATKAHRVTLDLSAAQVDVPVPLGKLTEVSALTVVDLTGGVVPTLKLNGLDQDAIPLVKGETRGGLSLTTLHLNCAAGGGQVVLELRGR